MTALRKVSQRKRNIPFVIRFPCLLISKYLEWARTSLSVISLTNFPRLFSPASVRIRILSVCPVLPWVTRSNRLRYRRYA